MIAIVSMGPHDPKAPMGWRTYEVRINHDVIARFQHKRVDGLARCLLEAAKAIERQKWEDAARILGECRHDAGHDLNGVGMWICKSCRADITPKSLEENRLTNTQLDHLYARVTEDPIVATAAEILQSANGEPLSAMERAIVEDAMHRNPDAMRILTMDPPVPSEPGMEPLESTQPPS